MNQEIKQVLIDFVEQLPTMLCGLVIDMLWASLLLNAVNVIFKTELAVTFMTCFYGAMVIMFIKDIADRASTTYKVIEESK
jgi:hypothetical protein